MSDQESMHINGLPFNETCYHMRDQLRPWVSVVREVMKHPIFKEVADGVRDEGEMKANLMLARRHLEDAIMRLGKAVQAFDGGKSVYPR